MEALGLLTSNLAFPVAYSFLVQSSSPMPSVEELPSHFSGFSLLSLSDGYGQVSVSLPELATATSMAPVTPVQPVFILMLLMPVPMAVSAPIGPMATSTLTSTSSTSLWLPLPPPTLSLALVIQLSFDLVDALTIAHAMPEAVGA